MFLSFGSASHLSFLYVSNRTVKPSPLKIYFENAVAPFFFSKTSGHSIKNKVIENGVINLNINEIETLPSTFGRNTIKNLTIKTKASIQICSILKWKCGVKDL